MVFAGPSRGFPSHEVFPVKALLKKRRGKYVLAEQPNLVRLFRERAEKN